MKLPRSVCRHGMPGKQAPPHLLPIVFSFGHRIGLLRLEKAS